jgi:uncharacterized protein with HEPN domain
MRLEARKYLLDIQVATDRIGRFTRGKSFEQYLADEMLRSAVERQFGIAGDILIHGYASVDDRIVWGVIENYLAQLRAAVRRLLDTPG